MLLGLAIQTNSLLRPLFVGPEGGLINVSSMYRVQYWLTR